MGLCVYLPGCLHAYLVARSCLPTSLSVSISSLLFECKTVFSSTLVSQPLSEMLKDRVTPER